LRRSRREQPSVRRNVKRLYKLALSHVTPPRAFSLGARRWRRALLKSAQQSYVRYDRATMQNQTIRLHPARGSAQLRSIFLLRHHSRCRRYGADRRHRRDRERQPRIPSRRPVGGIEFAISLQIEISLHVSDRKQKSDLWTGTDELISSHPERETVLDSTADRKCSRGGAMQRL
jgi:hypothetical protein